MTGQDWKKLIGQEVEITNKPATWNSNVRHLKCPLDLEYPLRGKIDSITITELNTIAVHIEIKGIFYGFSGTTAKVKVIPPKEKFKIGDIIVRTWPSGKVTLGEAVKNKFNENIMFKSLEAYRGEGGVNKGGIYGSANQIFQGIPHRLTTREEINRLKEPILYKTETHCGEIKTANNDDCMTGTENYVNYSDFEQEAKRRGFIPGAKFIDLVNKIEWEMIESASFLYRQMKDGSWYVPIIRREDYTNNVARIMKDGQWAKIVSIPKAKEVSTISDFGNPMRSSITGHHATHVVVDDLKKEEYKKGLNIDSIVTSNGEFKIGSLVVYSFNSKKKVEQVVGFHNEDHLSLLGRPEERCHVDRYRLATKEETNDYLLDRSIASVLKQHKEENHSLDALSYAIGAQKVALVTDQPVSHFNCYSYGSGIIPRRSIVEKPDDKIKRSSILEESEPELIVRKYITKIKRSIIN